MSGEPIIPLFQKTSLWAVGITAATFMILTIAYARSENKSLTKPVGLTTMWKSYPHRPLPQ